MGRRRRRTIVWCIILEYIEKKEKAAEAAVIATVTAMKMKMRMNKKLGKTVVKIKKKDSFSFFILFCLDFRFINVF